MVIHKPNDTNFAVDKAIVIGNCDIERVYTFKYLGIIIDSRMSFLGHFNHVNNRVNGTICRLYFLVRLVNELSF